MPTAAREPDVCDLWRGRREPRARAYEEAIRYRLFRGVHRGRWSGGRCFPPSTAPGHAVREAPALLWVGLNKETARGWGRLWVWSLIVNKEADDTQARGCTNQGGFYGTQIRHAGRRLAAHARSWGPAHGDTMTSPRPAPSGSVPENSPSQGPRDSPYRLWERQSLDPTLSSSGAAWVAPALLWEGVCSPGCVKQGVGMTSPLTSPAEPGQGPWTRRGHPMDASCSQDKGALVSGHRGPAPR